MLLEQHNILAMLDEAGVPAAVVTLAPGVDLIVSSFGGRLHGPFIDGHDPVGWVAPAFSSATSLIQMAEAGDWNIGGQRNWLSPELDFFVGDRSRFWETFRIPAPIDPGMHSIEQCDGTLLIRQHVDLPGLSIDIVRSIAPLSVEAVRGASQLRCAGYRHLIEVVSSAPAQAVVPWIISQVAPGGTAIIPVDPDTGATTMLETPPLTIMQEQSGAIRIPIKADVIFKVGIPAVCSHGKMGFLFPLCNEMLLQVFSFSHDRSGTYHDEPPDRPGINGFSTFVFQDDGTMGSYGELEFVGLDLGPSENGSRRGRLEIECQMFMGRPADVEKATIDRLGVTLGHR